MKGQGKKGGGFKGGWNFKGKGGKGDQKGKGYQKGGKGFQIQGGKGFQFQGAVNYNPSGYGYQGVCWNCGEVGHKSNECKALKAVEEGGSEGSTKAELEEVSASAVMCHGVWTLARVSSTPIKNRFGPLTEEAVSYTHLTLPTICSV